MSGWVLQVSAGHGPVEVRRFVAGLAAHLASRLAVREVIVRGDRDAPHSVSLRLDGVTDDARAMVGTHCLVARGEGRGRRDRKRWYAGVTLHPAGDGSAEATVDPREVRVTAMRAGGPGGQHVNKTSSAVRVVHAATGLAVRAADERSQRENLRLAMARLTQALRARAEARAQQGEADQRVAHHRVERGRPAWVYEADRDGGLRAL